MDDKSTVRMATDYKWLEAVGYTLRAHRERAGLSGRQFAQQLAVDHAYLSCGERGGRKVSARVIALYEHELDLKPGTVLEEAKARYHGERIPLGSALATSQRARARMFVTIEPSDDEPDIHIRLEVTAVTRCDWFAFGIIGKACTQAELHSIQPPTRLSLWRFVDPVHALTVTLEENLEPGQSITWKMKWKFYTINRFVVFPLEGFPLEPVEIRFEAFGCNPTEVFVMRPISCSLLEFVSQLPYGTKEPGEYPIENLDNRSDLDDDLYPLCAHDLEAPWAFGVQWAYKDRRIEEHFRRVHDRRDSPTN